MSWLRVCRWLGIGKLPKHQRAILESEEILILEETVRGSFTHREFRAPGKRFSWRREAFVGCLCLTRKRLVGFAFSKRLVDIPLDDSRRDKVSIALDGSKCLLISIEASDVHHGQSGRVECRFFTPRATLFMESLNREA